MMQVPSSSAVQHVPQKAIRTRRLLCHCMQDVYAKHPADRSSDRRSSTLFSVRISDQYLAQHQLGTILQRLSQMHGLDLFAPCQVCNCARQCSRETHKKYVMDERPYAFRTDFAQNLVFIKCTLAKLGRTNCQVRFGSKLVFNDPTFGSVNLNIYQHYILNYEKKDNT